MNPTWEPITAAIIAAATILAGAIKLLANSIGRGLKDHGREIADSTRAVKENTRALRDAATRRAALLLLPLLLFLGGCVNADPMVRRMIERNHQVWEEDRRRDLDPELEASRRREFAAQLNYLDTTR